MYKGKIEEGKLVYIERVGFKRIKKIDGTLRTVNIEDDTATYNFDSILYSGEKMKKFEKGGLVNFKGKDVPFEIEDVNETQVKFYGDWWYFIEVEHYVARPTIWGELPPKVIPADAVPPGHPALTPPPMTAESVLATPDAEDLRQWQSRPELKDTNPKDAAASTRLDISVFPDTAVCYGALAFTEGAYKYAAYNYRESGVNASVYYSSTRRHLMKWYNGEWADQKTGVPHLASALAGIAVLIEGHEMGNMNDDRPPRLDLSALLDKMEGKVKKLQELFPNKPPRCRHESD